MQKWTVAATVGVLMLSFASVAPAQLRRRAYPQEGYPAEQYQRGKSSSGQPLTAGRSPRAAGPMEGVHLTDEQLANWLLVDNRAEIQLARIAQERASCEEVQDFAKRMIDDHAEMVEKLQRFASTGRNPQAGTQPGQQPAGQGGGVNFVRLKQQLGQQCVTSAERELEEKEGEEFDKCFMGMQIGLHMHMLDTLKVFSRYASPQLDEVIEDGEQATQEHLDKAKELMKDHDGNEGKNRSSDEPVTFRSDARPPHDGNEGKNRSSDRSSGSRGQSSSNRDTSRDRDNDRD